MPRTIDPSTVEFIAGPVRVVKRRERKYRILWTEGKKQRERSATSLRVARQIAMDEASRLLATDATPVNSEHAFGVLLSIATDPSKRRWSDKWAGEVDRLTRIHLMPDLGHLPCSNITGDLIDSLLVSLSDRYSKAFVNKAYQIIARAVRIGVSRGIWEVGRDPMAFVDRPPSSVGRPDRRLIPTDSQVTQLIESMGSEQEEYGLMATLAAYTGVRWGELLALTKESVDLERETPVLWVTRNCVEHDGTFTFVDQGKTKASFRAITLEPQVIDALRRYLSTTNLPTGPAPGVNGITPRNRLFHASTLNPIRRSNWRKVFHRHRDRIDSWPDGATWHYMRHYCATRWVRAGLEIPAISTMIGHSQISTTHNWYVAGDEETLPRAAAQLAAFASSNH